MKVLSNRFKNFLFHCFDHNFPSLEKYRKWYSCPPAQLFDLPVTKKCQDDNSSKIKVQCIYNFKSISEYELKNYEFLLFQRTIEREARWAKWVIIWTDCDREGENIGFEIIDVCKQIKPGLRVMRAKFSEITRASVERALRNLAQPDERVSKAVDVRQELDLRIGAAL